MSGRRQNADIADTLHLRDVAMATPFCLSMGYNFGCMLASDTLSDSRGGFSGSSYPMKTVHERYTQTGQTDNGPIA